MLQKGTLFHFDIKQNAVRAYLQANEQDPTLHSLLHTKPTESGPFKNYRRVLAKINHCLTVPLYSPEVPTCQTLLEQLQQEEKLIQAYVKQTVEDKNTHAREIPRHKFYNVLNWINEGRSDPPTSYEFLNAFPQYSTPELQEYVHALCQNNASESRLAAIRYYRNTQPGIAIADALLKITQIMLGVILAITVGMGPYLEKLIGEGDAASGVGLVVGMLLVLATVVRLGGGFAGWEYEVGQDGADRKILKPFMASYFNAVTKWDRVLNPSTFHEKWLLRSYFSLMQAESVLTSEPLDARPRLNYTHLHTSDFARVVYHAYHHSFHAEGGDNPFFVYTH